MKDFAIVGSGIGGSSIAAYLDTKGYDTVLFEKEPYLGGCSSTFEKNGFRYNTGATTLAGYQDGHIVKTIFDAIGFQPQLIKTDPAIVIIQNNKTTPRYRDFEKFLEVTERNYPHPKNREFWSLVHEISEAFYAMKGHYYSNRSFTSKCCSLATYLPLLFKFKHYLRKNARDFIKEFYGGINDEYLSFLEAQIMIVAQARTAEINFFTAALSLGYTFNTTHYVTGGFSKLFDQMTASMPDVRRKSEITKIERHLDHFIVQTRKESIPVRKVILNSTVYDSAKLFDDPPIKQYYKKYKHLDNHQSSFMLYMTIKSDKVFEHHYQLIQDENHPYTLSNALFVSFSDKSDNVLAPEGHYSVTVSIHTSTRMWNDQSTYKMQKQNLEKSLIKTICDTLEINDSEIVHHFAATPKTFERYINRSQLGGNAITMKNFLPKLPGNDTPIKGLYHVGDTVYAAQGWPGVMLGVDNLRKLLNV